MSNQSPINPVQTLLALVNHILTQHPEVAPYVEQIVQNVRGNTDMAALMQWASRAYAAPSPQCVKQTVLVRNAFENAIWIETGTYLGQTTKVLMKHGSFVYSIEPEPMLYAKACELFKPYPNVEIIKGLSEEVFPVILPKLEGDINFWLDGHYSEGLTHRGPQDTPIGDELRGIAENIHRFRRVCVMVDDVRCFNPELKEYSTYPALKSLVDWAEANRLGWHIEHDIFVAKTK